MKDLLETRKKIVEMLNSNDPSIDKKDLRAELRNLDRLIKTKKLK